MQRRDYLAGTVGDLALLAVIVDVADDALAVGGLAALVDHAGGGFASGSG